MTVIPKLASTVILMDRYNHIFLTKRPITMKFLGGYFVFPGGSVDDGDNDVQNHFMINVPEDIRFDLSHYVAAARELFEEVGVLLTEPCPNHKVLTPTKLQNYREKLIKGKLSFPSFLKQEGFKLNFNRLHYFGHRITPKTSPHRYDTRFFIAKLPEGQSPIPDKVEIDEAIWTTPAEALLAYERGDINLAPPTKMSLITIKNHLSGEGPLMLPNRLSETDFLKKG